MPNRYELIRKIIVSIWATIDNTFNYVDTRLVILSENSNNLIAAKNSKHSAKNDLKDYQKIKTAEFTVPVIFAGVLHYEPGELGMGTEIGRKGADVYYTPESISDPEYLETVKRSAINIATHEKNTDENNRDPDGWPIEVYFDPGMGTEGAVVIKGIAHGSDNIAYINENKNKPGFGASAYIDFLGIVEEEGKTPDGQRYTAKTTKLVNNHIAVLPNIRDAKNVILAMNALDEENLKPANLNDKSTKPEVKNSKHGFSFFKSKKSQSEVKMDPEEIKALITASVKNAMNEAKEEDSEGKWKEDTTNAIKGINERLDKIDAENKAKNTKGKNEAFAGEETPEEEKEEEEIEKNITGEGAKNARPSQDMVKDISEGMGIVYTKTPTFSQLASDVGIDITGKKFHEIVGALNAKRSEIKNFSTPGAKNSGDSEGSLGDLMKIL